MSYFIADDKLPVLQQQVSIPSENGLSYNSTQTIELNIPAGTKFINPKNCYLQFNVKLTNDETSDDIGRLRTSLDGPTGAQCLIKDLRIYDGNKNQLLEEYLDYNVMVAMKYDYETNDSLKNKRGLMEGCQVDVPETRGDRGSTKSMCNQFVNNPYFTNDTSEPQITNFSNADNMRSAKVCLPLHTGIFQNDAIFPTMLTNGLHLSITLEEDRKVFRMMDGCALDRRTTLNPIVFSTNGSTSGSIANGSEVTVIETYAANNQIDATRSPFVVGQYVNFYQTSTGTSASFTVSGSTTKKYLQISKIETIAGPRVKYTFDTSSASITNATGATITTDGSWIMHDETLEPLVVPFQASYEVSNVEMVLEQIQADSRYEAGMMAKMKEGGVITYDFLSATNYKFSQLVADRVANIRLPINNARMKSILSIPTDATVYTIVDNMLGANAQTGANTYAYAPNYNRDYFSYSNRSGLVGISDNISNYSWFYDGRLQPSRRVDLTKTSTRTSISAQGLIELDKALTAAGIDTHSMENYSENFMIGRAVAIGKNNVYDARNKDFNLQVNYQETAAPTKPHLWHNFVFHIRRLNIQGESISVEI